MFVPRLKRLFRRSAAVSGRTGSLRVRMLLLVLLAILPMLLLILATNLEERHTAEQRVQGDTKRLLHLTISQHERLIEGSRQLLIALAQIPVVRDRSEAACSTLFGNFLKQYPFYVNLGAADLEGNVYCSGLRLAEPVNLADRGYFQRALQYKGLVIGDYQIGRITGKASVNIGYPILDGTGSPKGVVYAALDLRWLEQLAVEARLPPDSVLIVLDRHGTVLFEHPDWRRWMGVAGEGNPLVETILSHQEEEEGAVELPNLEGVTSLFAFAPLRSTSGVVITTQGYLAVGIPTSVAFAQVNRAFAYRLLFFSAVAVLALAMAWRFGAVFILRPARALLAATERLEEGDLQTRTGLLPGHGELSQLAGSFDRMAERLQEHQAQLRHALTETTELKDLLDNVFASIVSGVITTDLQGKIMLCNLAALHILGYREAEELIGCNIVELQPPLGDGSAVARAERRPHGQAGNRP